MMQRARPARLHLGCFDCIVPGWVNTDITPHIWVARIPFAARLLFGLGRITAERYEQHRRGLFKRVRYLDATKRFPYPDESFDVVFSSHFLEHLFPDEAAFCLTETYRVLRSGGVCRVVVPDLDKIISEYSPDAPEGFLKRTFEFSDRKSIKNVHHWHYNEHSLRSLLSNIGFRLTRRCAYGEGLCPDLELLDNRPEESLYVEAVK